MGFNEALSKDEEVVNFLGAIVCKKVEMVKRNLGSGARCKIKIFFFFPNS